MTLNTLSAGNRTLKQVVSFIGRTVSAEKILAYQRCFSNLPRSHASPVSSQKPLIIKTRHKPAYADPLLATNLALTNWTTYVPACVNNATHHCVRLSCRWRRRRVFEIIYDTFLFHVPYGVIAVHASAYRTRRRTLVET